MVILSKFKERHIKGYYKAALQKYHRKDKPITLTTVYQEWYKQRTNDNWESFNKQLNKNITIKQPFNDRHTKHIKGALIINLDDLKEESAGWKKKQQITILAKDYFKKWSRNRQFKITKDDKPRVDPKHLVYYTLLQIVCVDDLCDMYFAPKKKQQKYPTRMHWS